MRPVSPYHFSDMGAAARGMDINGLVAKNLRKILGEGRSPEVYCQERGRELFYVSGSKKGKKVAPRALRYALDEEQSPRLDLVAAVAAKEGLHPYQLLFFDFDPENAPLMISKEHAELIRKLQEAPKTTPATLMRKGP